LAVIRPDGQGSPANLDLLQVLQDLPGQSSRQIDGAVPFVELDAADIVAGEARLARDGTDDVARGHPVRTTDLNTKAFELGLVRARQ
jgi:hypothetical protein